MTRGQVNMADKAKLCSPILSTFEALVVHMWSGVVVEKNWNLSVDQCWLQALQFSVHLINLLSILLRCHGFTGIQKAVVEQTAANHRTVTMTFFFFWCKFGLGKCSEASSLSRH